MSASECRDDAGSTFVVSEPYSRDYNALREWVTSSCSPAMQRELNDLCYTLFVQCCVSLIGKNHMCEAHAMLEERTHTPHTVLV